MSEDFNARQGARTPEDQASLFARTPVWARDAKPQSDPARDAGEAGAGAGVLGATTAAEPADAVYETQPARARARHGGASAAAVVAGLAAAASLAGVGWYASQQHPGGLAVLTPGGAPAPTRTALGNHAPPGARALPVTRVSDPSPATGEAAANPSVREKTPRARNQIRSAGDNASDTSTAVPLPATPATAAQTDSQTQRTNLNPLAGTTSPVPSATTPSASSADPGSSPASTPSPSTSP
jgi:hypothetical protein